MNEYGSAKKFLKLRGGKGPRIPPQGNSDRKRDSDPDDDNTRATTADPEGEGEKEHESNDTAGAKKKMHLARKKMFDVRKSSTEIVIREVMNNYDLLLAGRVMAFVSRPLHQHYNSFV